MSAVAPGLLNAGADQVLARSLSRHHVRTIRSSDAVLLERFGAGLSLTSRYQRFFSPRGFMPGEVERLTSIDPRREAALIATTGTADDTELVAVARYVLDAASDEAELAIVVADAWQGRGLGAELLQRLIDHAQGEGVRAINGMVLASNGTMQKLARRLGFNLTHVPGDSGVVQMHRDLRPVH